MTLPIAESYGQTRGEQMTEPSCLKLARGRLMQVVAQGIPIVPAGFQWGGAELLLDAIEALIDAKLKQATGFNQERGEVKGESG